MLEVQNMLAYYGKSHILHGVNMRIEAGEIRFVLIDGPGRAAVRAAPDALVREVIEACCA